MVTAPYSSPNAELTPLHPGCFMVNTNGGLIDIINNTDSGQ